MLTAGGTETEHLQVPVAHSPPILYPASVHKWPWAMVLCNACYCVDPSPLDTAVQTDDKGFALDQTARALQRSESFG